MVVFVLLCTLFMLIICLYLYHENELLKNKIINIEKQINDIIKEKITPSKENVISINSISKESSQKEEKQTKIDNLKKEEVKKREDNNIQKPTKYVAKNNYEDIYELNLRKTTIPNKLTNNNFEPLDFINKKDKKSNYNKDYLKEVSNNLSNSTIPSIIELTDYEKKEEDQAVISYQELLSLKENKNNKEVDNKNFLNDLKDFRKNIDKNT